MLSLGGGFNGISPKQTNVNYKDSEDAMMRKTLRSSWNTSQATGTVNNKKRIITPFRAVNNMGDFLGRQNYVCGGPNPNGLPRGGISFRFGSIISQCDNSGVAAGSSNMRHVPDSSDYTKFKKQSAMNKNYNDMSNGGYNNAAYTSIMAARR
jgi:hypothetical protein